MLGNKMEEDVAWRFTVADLGIEKTIVTLKALKINTVYIAAYANLLAPQTVTFTTALLVDIASLLSIGTERMRVSAIVDSPTGGSLLDIEFTSTMADSEDASQLAYEFYSSIFSNVFDQQLAYLTTFNQIPAQASKKVDSHVHTLTHIHSHTHTLSLCLSLSLSHTHTLSL